MKKVFTATVLLLFTGLFINACSKALPLEENPPLTQYTLTVSFGEGGTVTPAASGSYEEGTTITLSATPDEGYVFDRWEGSDFDNSGCGFARYCRTAVTMNSNRSVDAFFQRISE